MKNVAYILLTVLLLTACRSTRTAVHQHETILERSDFTDSIIKNGLVTVQDEKENLSFLHEWEDFDIEIIHERDSIGERTKTNIRKRSGKKKETENRQLRDSSVQESFSDIRRALVTSDQHSEKDVRKESEPVAPVTTFPWELIIIFVLAAVIIVWPEPLRRMMRFIKGLIEIWLRR